MPERSISFVIEADTTRFTAAMRDATAVTTRLAERIERFKRIIATAFASIYRSTVKPSRSSTVRPLCIDGHAYRRRRQARRRR